jgi:hypothetical protein
MYWSCFTYAGTDRFFWKSGCMCAGGAQCFVFTRTFVGFNASTASMLVHAAWAFAMTSPTFGLEQKRPQIEKKKPPCEADQSPVLYQNTKIPKYQTVFCPKYQKSKRGPCKIPKNQTGACVWYSKFQRFKKRFDFLVFCLSFA